MHTVTGSNSHLLAGHSILVTAGPTWVEVDRVRVLTTIFTGATGLAIARHLAECGAKVDLWMGPARVPITDADRASLSIIDFRTYDDLAKLVKERQVDHYSAIVHSAAVADYKPIPAKGKIASGEGVLTLTLHPTEKLVDILRERAPRAVLVKFKLEVGLTTEELLAVAERSRAHSRAEFIMANSFEGMSPDTHQAHLLDDAGGRADYTTKAGLCAGLAAALARRLTPRP
jgi:phosphopantothenoylcysteine synthetase/decarboxylase